MFFIQFGLSCMGAVAPDEPPEGKVVQRRGRFQVTSDNIAQKVLDYLIEKSKETSIVNS